MASHVGEESPAAEDSLTPSGRTAGNDVRCFRARPEEREEHKIGKVIYWPNKCR